MDKERRRLTVPAHAGTYTAPTRNTYAILIFRPPPPARGPQLLARDRLPLVAPRFRFVPLPHHLRQDR